MSTPANDLAAMLAELVHNDRERLIADRIQASFDSALDALAAAQSLVCLIDKMAANARTWKTDDQTDDRTLFLGRVREAISALPKP